jgi:hypothetical protein
MRKFFQTHREGLLCAAALFFILAVLAPTLDRMAEQADYSRHASASR